MMQLNNKRVLITGGTGSVGLALAEKLLLEFDSLKIDILCNSEQELFETAGRFGSYQSQIHYHHVDVQDLNKLQLAFSGVDIVVHCAAMKHVPIAEANPASCAAINVIGTQNVIQAAVVNKVECVVAVSSDKAVLPINTYGASKLMVERLIVDANSKYDTRFAIVRYANVFGSKGSVVPFFKNLIANNAEYLPITDPRMTRFSITMDEGIGLILWGINQAKGGEIVVPISASYRIMDVAEALDKDSPTEVVGIRPGEKLHEIMIGEHEIDRTVRAGNIYIVLPEYKVSELEHYCDDLSAVKNSLTEAYSSGSNDDFMSVEDIKTILSSIE